MNSPEVWRWIWLVATALFAIGEIMTPGFFMLPFAIGAGTAAVLAFFGATLTVQWVVFVAVSVTCFLALRPIARRLDREESADGTGSRRLIGEAATVIEAIGGPGDVGLVRVEREEWRAESGTKSPIEVGARVRVTEVTGTRVVVFPLAAEDDPAPEPADDSSPSADTDAPE